MDTEQIEQKPPRRSRLRRVLRGMLLTVGSLIALILLIVGSTVLFLSTDGGKRFAVRKGLEVANNAIPGQLQVGSVDIRWRSHIRIQGFKLLTPGGEPVIQLEAANLEFRLWDLLQRQATIEKLEVVRPQVRLVYDAQGQLNLEAALGPSKEEPPKEPWDGTLPVAVQAPRLEVVDGAFELRDLRASEPVLVALQNLDLTAAYHYREARHHLQITPLQLQLEQPEAGLTRLEADLTFAMKEDEQQIEVARLRLEAPGLKLDGSGGIADFDRPRGRITLAASPIDVEFIKVFAPDLPMKGSSTLALTAEGDGRSKVRLDARLTLPAGEVALTGALDLSGLEHAPSALGYDVQLKVREVQLSALLTGEVPPLGPINLTAAAIGTGLDPQSMNSRLRLDLAPISYQKYLFQGGTATASIINGIITLDESRIETPWARLIAHGRVDLKGPIDVRVTAEAGDLRRIGQEVGQPIRGEATVVARATGTLEAPLIDFQVSARKLAYGPVDSPTIRLEDLQAKGDVKLPKSLEGKYDPQVSLSASGTRLGSSGVFLERLRLEATYRAPEVRASLDGVDPKGRPVALTALATLGETSQVIRVSRLRAPLGETAWSLQNPFTTTIAGRTFYITPFRIAGAEGSLSGGGTLSLAGRSDFKLDGTGVQLEGFGALLPESVAGLRGGVELASWIKGPAAAPELFAHVQLSQVAARSIPETSGHLRLTTVGAAGQRTALQADLFMQDGATLLGRINLPMALSLTGTPTVPPNTPLGGLIRLDGFNLTTLAALEIEGAEQYTGKVSAYLNLSGTRVDPRLQLQVVGTAVTFQSPRPIDMNVNLAFAEKRLRLDGQVFNPDAKNQALIHAQLDVPIEVTRDLQVKPIWDEPVNGQITLDAREAQALAPLFPGLERAKGLLGLEFAMSGSARDPAITARVRARQVQLQAYPAMDLDVDVAYKEGQAAMVSRSRVGSAPFATLDARLKLNLSQVLQGGELRLSDLRAALDITRFDLMQLPPVIRGPQLRGGVLTLRASLESQTVTPTFQLLTVVDGLSVGEAKDHRVELTGAYQADSVQLSGRVTSGSILQAELAGAVPLELRLPLNGGQTRVDYGQGLNVRVNIPGLDVSLANAFLPNQASIGGVLRGHVGLTGALDAPDVQGALKLTRGQVFLPAQGVYYDQIRLASEFTRAHLSLTEGVFRGGKGQALVTGSLEMTNGQPGALQAAMRFVKFEAMDGTYGRTVVDGNLKVEGTASAPVIRGELRIPGGVIKLPDIASSVVMQVAGLERRKQLAPLELPGPVLVMTRNELFSWKEYTTGKQELTQDAPLALDANVLIRVARDLWIQNEAQEIIAEVKGDVRLLAERGTFRLEGEVEVVRGELRLFTQPLLIEQGTITFTGGTDIDPRLDIVASAEVGEWGKVGLRVTGLASRPELEFTSDRGYDTADTLALLIMGRPLSEAQDPNATQKVEERLEALAAGALSSWARKQFAAKLPIDLLQFEAESFSSANLRIGKYVTPRLFLVYRRRFNTDPDEPTDEARAEYQLTRSIYIETFFGRAQTHDVWGGEVTWRRYY